MSFSAQWYHLNEADPAVFFRNTNVMAPFRHAGKWGDLTYAGLLPVEGRPRVGACDGISNAPPRSQSPTFFNPAAGTAVPTNVSISVTPGVVHYNLYTKESIKSNSIVIPKYLSAGDFERSPPAALSTATDGPDNCEIVLYASIATVGFPPSIPAVLKCQGSDVTLKSADSQRSIIGDLMGKAVHYMRLVAKYTVMGVTKGGQTIVDLGGRKIDPATYHPLHLKPAAGPGNFVEYGTREPQVETGQVHNKPWWGENRPDVSGAPYSAGWSTGEVYSLPGTFTGNGNVSY
jgi:hypothetical protein